MDTTEVVISVAGCYSVDIDGELVFFFRALVYDRLSIFIRFSYNFFALMDTTEDADFCNWMLFARSDGESVFFLGLLFMIVTGSLFGFQISFSPRWIQLRS